MKGRKLISQNDLHGLIAFVVVISGLYKTVKQWPE